MTDHKGIWQNDFSYYQGNQLTICFIIGPQ